MKYLKIHIRGKADGGMIYPDNYETEIGIYAVDHLYYEQDGIQMLLLCIPDGSYKPSMVRDYATEITEVEANEISEDKEIRTEEIKDEAKLRRLELKTHLNIPLTIDEENAIKLGTKNSVFGVRKILSDRISDLKVNEEKQTNK